MIQKIKVTDSLFIILSANGTGSPAINLEATDGQRVTVDLDDIHILQNSLKMATVMLAGLEDGFRQRRN